MASLEAEILFHAGRHGGAAAEAVTAAMAINPGVWAVEAACRWFNRSRLFLWF